MANKIWCLEQAIEITKEWARGGAEGSPAGYLNLIYQQLVKLEDEANS